MKQEKIFLKSLFILIGVVYKEGQALVLKFNNKRKEDAMKKLVTLMLVVVAAGLSACANKGGADYGYETTAPYADERTVGNAKAPAKSGDQVFQRAQAK